jgi:hypothetical protein
MPRQPKTSNVSPVAPERVPEKQEVSMTFGQALDQVMKGKRVTKREWNNQDVYVFMKETYLSIHMADGKDSVLLVRDGDILGMDWFVVE